MLIRFPPDYRSNEEISDTIKSFGRLLFWQRDNSLAQVIIKTRVTDLSDVPHYIIISEGDGFEGVSLTVQCEIMQQSLLDGMPQDEDIPPGGFDDGDFVFPGIAQDGQWGQQLNLAIGPQQQPLPEFEPAAQANLQVEEPADARDMDQLMNEIFGDEQPAD
jgi:hypothetical protein